MEEATSQFIRGFNSGYLLSKHDPDLLNSLLKSQNNDSEYIQAMILGKKEHDRELLLAQLKQSQKSNQRDRDL